MTDQTARLNILWAKLIVETLFRRGVTTFFLSPGSRSTPLVIAISQHPGVESIVHYDERGSSFCALGFAKYQKYKKSSSGCHAAWVCTSGTALANALPAAIEAWKSHTPLVFISADRPPELKERGANQTIAQDDILKPFSRWQGSFGEAPDESEILDALKLIDEGLSSSVGFNAGPIHVNLGFRKPLHGNLDEIPLQSDFRNSEVLEWLNEVAKPSSIVDEIVDLDSISLNESSLAILGGETSIEDAHVFARFCQNMGIPLIVDAACPHQITGDQIISYGDLLAPELFDGVVNLIHLGDRITSSSIQAEISRRSELNYIHICNYSELVDPGFSVSVSLKGRLKKSDSEKVVPLRMPISSRETEIEDVFEDSLNFLSEASVVQNICRLTPEESPLWIGNSLAIRQVDSFASKKDIPFLRGSNRGASGIDGQIASSTGFAKAAERRGVLLIGDLGFLHDLNSLKLCDEQAMTIVVINNDGGGIFSLLPIAKHENVFEKYFGTPHGLSFESAAKLFGLDYVNPDTLKDFREQFANSLLSEKSTIIEIETNRADTQDLAVKVRKLVSESRPRI